jgi:predicted Fe-S protein YdhL (DUF1289 family)
MSNIQSPCTLVCSIDPKTGYCFGCGRTGDEITKWVDYTPQQRTEIMGVLSARLEEIDRKPRRVTRRQQIKRNKEA